MMNWIKPLLTALVIAAIAPHSAFADYWRLPALPADYRALEYIDATNSYWKLKFGTAEMDEILMNVIPYSEKGTSSSQDTAFFCCRAQVGYSLMLIKNKNGTNNGFTYTRNPTAQSSVKVGSYVAGREYVIRQTNGWIDVNGEIAQSTQSVEPTCDFTSLFAWNEKGIDFGGILCGRFLAFNVAGKCSLVPVIDSSGTPCLFDLVTQRPIYATLSTDGELVAGPVLQSAEQLTETQKEAFCSRIRENVLTVSGDPDECCGAAVSPAYGFNMVVDGEAYNCTVPAVYTNDEDKIIATCTGYTLSVTNLSSGGVERLATGTGSSLSYTHVTGNSATLIWHFTRQFKIVVNAATGGIAASSELWPTENGRVVLTATADSGHVFSHWTGEIPEGIDRTSAVLSFCADSPRTLTPVFGTAIYVSQGGGSDTNNGLSWDTAYASVSNALLHVVADSVLFVTNGTYELAGPVISEPFSMVGVGSRDNITLQLTAPVIISNACASVKNLKITRKSGSNGAVHLYNGGLVEGCSISGFKDTNGKFGGLHVVNGTVRDSLVYDNKTAWGGAGAKLVAGLIERCIFHGNTIHQGNGDAVIVSGGILRNSLIYGNVSHKLGTTQSTGLSISGGLAENCTIVANIGSAAGAAMAGVVVSGSAILRNCLIYGNYISTGEYNIRIADSFYGSIEYTCVSPLVDGYRNIESTPSFVDYEGRDFRLEYCGCVDAGRNMPWMTDATDLSCESPRIQNGTVDIGCYESERAEFSCMFSVSTDEALEESSVTLTASGDGLAGATYNWTIADAITGEIVESFSGVNADSLVRTLPVGKYSVRLAVSNGAQSAEYSQENCISVRGSTLYANAIGTQRRPYASYATGITNINEAVDLVAENGTLYVKEGEYTTSRAIVPSSGARIVSESGPRRTTIRGGAGETTEIIHLGSASALLSGITVTGLSGSKSACGVLITDGGVVSNCVIRDISLGLRGHGIEMSAGTVLQTSIFGNTSYSSGNISCLGVGIQMSGGLVDCCVVSNNCATDGEQIYASAGIYMTGGIVRNTLVAFNSHNIGVGGVSVMNGILENSIVAANTNRNVRKYDYGYEIAAGVCASENSVLKNNIIIGNITKRGYFITDADTETNIAFAASCTFNNNIVREADALNALNGNCSGNFNAEIEQLFTSVENGDFHPPSESPAYNVGLYDASWMDFSQDLDGLPRVKHFRNGTGLVDIGCYEGKYIPTAAVILLR